MAPELFEETDEQVNARHKRETKSLIRDDGTWDQSDWWTLAEKQRREWESRKNHKKEVEETQQKIQGREDSPLVCEECLAYFPRPARGRAKFCPNCRDTINSPKTDNLVCRECKKEFPRRPGRGRQPVLCEGCRP